MLSFQPTLRCRCPDPEDCGRDPLCVLYEMAAGVTRHDRSLMASFFAACSYIDDLPLYEGLHVAVQEALRPSGDPVPDVPFENSVTVPSDEEIFVGCRDLLTCDWTRSRLEERPPTYREFKTGLVRAAARLAVGDDPRQPW